MIAGADERAREAAHYATHEELKESPAWSLLPFVGVQTFGDGEPPLELRNCVCGSTLSREVTNDNHEGG